MPQRDIVLRWLAQISLLIRRLLYGPGPVDIELAAHHLDEALHQHLGPMADLVARLDPPSAADLLHDPERIFGYAQLVGLQAAVLAARGDPNAAAIGVRSIALGREAVARTPDPPAEWSEWLDDAGTGNEGPGTGDR